MVSHAVWKTWPSGLSYDKNLGLRPRFLSTESLGPCFSHGTGDHDQILQYIYVHIRQLPSYLGHRWFRCRLVAASSPVHHMIQCWLIDNCTLGNNFLWNSNTQYTNLHSRNQFENVVCKLATILSRHRCVKWRNLLMQMAPDLGMNYSDLP